MYRSKCRYVGELSGAFFTSGFEFDKLRMRDFTRACKLLRSGRAGNEK